MGVTVPVPVRVLKSILEYKIALARYSSTPQKKISSREASQLPTLSITATNQSNRIWYGTLQPYKWKMQLSRSLPDNCQTSISLYSASQTGEPS